MPARREPQAHTTVAVSGLPLPPPHRLARFALALAIVGGATLFRLAFDPLLEDQLPYFLYTGAVVLASWFCGVDGGVLACVVSGFVANYLFVPPRYALAPRPEEAMGIALFIGASFGLVWVVNRWRRAESELRQQVDELQTVLDTVPAAVFVTRDPDAHRIDGNRLAAEFMRVSLGGNLSKTPDSPRSSSPRVLLEKNGVELTGTDLPVQRACFSGEDVRDFEFDLVNEDGSRRSLFGHATPLRDADGRVCGAIGAFIDVSERKRLEAEVQERVRELEEADRIKDEFLATLSHELRTPLSAIVGWSDMLRRGQLSGDAVARAVDSIFRNAKAQSHLVNDILDVSRIIGGRTRIDVSPTDPVAVLQAAIESVAAAADAKKIQMRSQVGPVPGLISADANRLQQIFWNLLSNAIKFTPAGGQVSVSLRHADSHIEVKVADTGVGISGEFLPHVFDRFRQRDSSITRRHAGLGLGLAIVRHLVELHGGTVTAQSPGEGQGATFVVSLPARTVSALPATGAPAVAEAQTAVSESAALPGLDGIRVLIVDDEPENLDVAAALLRSQGAVVELSARASDAEGQLVAFRPNVILIDLAMPEVDGYTLIERLRTTSAGRTVPAIALSAYARQEDVRRAALAGFNRHVAKPVDAETLVKAVASVCETGP